jgi:hypothetical protein
VVPVEVRDDWLDPALTDRDQVTALLAAIPDPGCTAAPPRS